MSRRAIWVSGVLGAVLVALVIAVAWVMIVLSDPERATPILRDRIAAGINLPTELESGWVAFGWKPVVHLRALEIEGRGRSAELDARLNPFGWLFGARLVEHVRIDEAAWLLRLGEAGGGPPSALDHVQSVDLADVRLDILKSGRDPAVVTIQTATGDLATGDFVMQARGGEAEMSLTGRAAGLSLDGFRGEMEVSGRNFASFASLFGLAAPDTPPFTLSGGLARNGGVWRFDPFEGVVGHSDLAGSMEADLGGERPMLRADLVSQNLDFTDLGVMVGAPSEAGGEENEVQAAANRAYAASDRLIPAAALDFTRVRAADAELSFRADAVRAGVLPLRAMEVEMSLRDAVMTFSTLAFEAPFGGRLDSRIVIDATQDVTRTQAQGVLTALDLRNIGGGKLVRGDLAGRYELSMTGSDLRSAFASSNGQVVLWAESGAQLRQLASEAAGLHMLDVILTLLTEDSQDPAFIPVRCAAARFTVTDGIAVANPAVLDTEESLIRMQGQVSLRDETIRLAIDSDSKQAAWGNLLGDVRIGGTLRNPSGEVRALESLLQGGAAVLLAGLAGPLAALPFIDLGLGEDAPCGRLMARATGESRGFTDGQAEDGSP